MSGPGLQGIHAVGGVVPPGLLARIQAGELKDPTGLAPASYHLVGRETVRDAASRAWSYLRGAWTAWREHTATQPPGTHGIPAARERWLLVLLRELGYGQVPALPAGYTIDDRHYPVSHAWQHIPIHLLGPGVNLNHRNPHVPGAARAPQAMLQELLNRSDAHLWGILSNGLRLRLLRDSTALAGSAYLEFDLETIFDGELYPEFLLMWQLCHVSRLEQRPGTDDKDVATLAGCWLEIWRGEAAEAGTRMLDRLRDGVADAIAALGTGFIRHPANRPLVEALRDGTLSTAQYHRALLRLVYRLLFCFVAEDRAALLHPNATAQARDRYSRYFSTARLRKLSRSRAGSPHSDLWQAQTLVLRALGGHGHPGLGLPPLAGLFDPDPHLPTIDRLPADPLLGCELTNEDLLTAVRKLAWVALPGQRVQPVDYRNLGAEELGSVYESLLELVPRVDLADRTLRLVTVSGNDRKTTGSYYTPPSLVSALLDTALDPLLDEATAGASSPADAETRLLALTVCDPACGSGHFLVAAARRIARRLAQVRSGDDEPTPAQIQHALRDVVGHCIYGVDLNDLAAELAKISLWMEALEPGKPLGFLDARIRTGNSLLGATPALLRGPLPDQAFKDLDGDDKRVATAVRKRNRAEAVNKDGYAQDALFFDVGAPSNATLAAQRAALLNLPDDVGAVRAQANRWAAREESPEYQASRIIADTWCAAFCWPLSRSGDPHVPEPPTNAVMRAMESDPLDESFGRLVGFVRKVAAHHHFFHWHLEFPEIFRVDDRNRHTTSSGWAGGFSCVVGNPPWDQMQLDPREFFAWRAPEIAAAPTMAKRNRMISVLENNDPALLHAYRAAVRGSDEEKHFVHASGRFPLTSYGRLNKYSLFAELFQSLLSADGSSGAILPTGIATDSFNQRFFRDVVERQALVAVLDFENEERVFQNVHNQYRFSLLTVNGDNRQCGRVSMAFRMRQASQIGTSTYTLAPDEILALNPNTGTCPVFQSRRDAEITLHIYKRIPVLMREIENEENPWELKFQLMLMMNTDSGKFYSRSDLDAGDWTLEGNIATRNGIRMLPLYEAKHVHHFDHRFSTYDGATQEQLNKGTLPRLDDEAHGSADKGVLPRYWVAEDVVEGRLAGDIDRSKAGWSNQWLLGWRDTARSVDERTLIGTVIPRYGVAHKYLLALPHIQPFSALQANLAAFILDYVARQKLSGPSMGYFIVKQLPVLPPTAYQEDAQWHVGIDLEAWITPRVLELSFTAYDLEGFARDMGDGGPPFVWDRPRRALLRAELDAAYFHLYGVARDDVDYIMDTFKVVRERDEKTYGEYRTKRMILEIYDAMQHAIDTGKPYATIVDPPPGHGARHPARDEALA